MQQNMDYSYKTQKYFIQIQNGSKRLQNNCYKTQKSENIKKRYSKILELQIYFKTVLQQQTKFLKIVNSCKQIKNI